MKMTDLIIVKKKKDGCSSVYVGENEEFYFTLQSFRSHHLRITDLKHLQIWKMNTLVKVIHYHEFELTKTDMNVNTKDRY